MKTVTRVGATALLLSLMMGIATAAEPSSDLATRRAALTALLSEQWEYNLKNNPEFASIIGDKRYNDRLSDFSQAAIEADLKKSAEFLTRFEAIDSTGFPVQEHLNKQLMVRNLKLSIEGSRFKEWEMPVLQNSGIHIDAPQMVSMLSFATVKDYEDYIARLKQLPRVFNETTIQMQKGMHDRLMPPKFLIPQIVKQTRAIGSQQAKDSPFAEPVKKFPADFSSADQARLSAAVLEAIKHDVLPAYKRFGTFVQERYLPMGRKDVGLWSLPDGDAIYTFRAKQSTTTDQTPEQIHQLGLAEVARIEGEMVKIAHQLGFADLKAMRKAMEKNPALHPTSRQHILDLYTKYTDQMYPKLPELFGILPKGKVEIVSIEQFREKGAAGAQYNQGTPDGSRPGKVMVNTGDFASRSTVSIETTALHEGVPGHHMQIAIAQELEGLPPFRQQGNYTAYAEGWALYAERLGEELGFYKDPYSYYGHLEDEMLRAIRLVVDTGLHYKKWNRAQVVDFFHNHSGIEEVEVQSETDRYIVWPGQALGYKIGQLKILALRDYAKTELGAKFDLRGFHDTVLGAGPLPMDVLEKQVKAWVEAQKKG
ncbi:MAG: DUF885 family protein [Pseudomonadota bacterium]